MDPFIKSFQQVWLKSRNIHILLSIVETCQVLVQRVHPEQVHDEGDGVGEEAGEGGGGGGGQEGEQGVGHADESEQLQQVGVEPVHQHHEQQAHQRTGVLILLLRCVHRTYACKEII